MMTTMDEQCQSVKQPEIASRGEATDEKKAVGRLSLVVCN